MMGFWREVSCYVFNRHRYGEATWGWNEPGPNGRHYWFRVCDVCQRIERIEDQGPPPVYWTRNEYGVLQENLK